MNIICFAIGFVFGFAICSVLSIHRITTAYEDGYKEGKNETVSNDK